MRDDDLVQLEGLFSTDLEQARATSDFDGVYLKYFSKSSGLTMALVKSLAALSSDEKRYFGPKVNSLQEAQKTALQRAQDGASREAQKDARVDLTHTVSATNRGHLHPLTQVITQINSFFRYQGFSIYEGPEIETEEFNFRKLNLPEGHPATDLQDTLYISTQKQLLLRTHTSSIEARVLTEQEPPIRVAFPGRCYRNETPNATNSSFFHQYQGVVVDKGITIQHLKYILEEFHKFLFDDPDITLRFRYKYYPEVSPGMGVDMQCKFCHGEGCPVCKHRGYIEILGSGMIHYNTLKMCGINPETYTGFAFGMGLDRLIMQKTGIDDIRKLYGGGMYYENSS